MLKWVFGADTGPYRSALNSMRSETKAFASEMRSQIAGAIGVAGVVSALNKWKTSASDLQESISKSGTVFGDNAKAVESWSEKLASGFGQAQSKALEAAASFGAVFKVLGIGPAESAKMSRSLVELASDMASFHNSSPAEALEAISAGLRGESEPLRRFAVLLDDATLKAEAMKLGIFDGTGSLTAQSRALAAYQVILKQTSSIKGDFAKNADQVANSERIVAAQAENASAAIGSHLLPMYQKFLNFAKSEDGAKWGDSIGKGIRVAVNIFQTSFEALGALIGWISKEIENDFNGIVQLAKNTGEVLSKAFSGDLSGASGAADRFKKTREEISALRTANNSALKENIKDIYANAQKSPKYEPPAPNGNSDADMKAVEEDLAKQASLKKEIAKLEEEARKRALSAEKKIADAERRRAEFRADSNFADTETKRLEALKSALEVEKEIADLRKQADTDQKKINDDLVSAKEAQKKAERDNEFAALDDQGKLTMLKKEHDAALIESIKLGGAGKETESLKKRTEATTIQGEIDALRRGIADDARGKLQSLQSRGPTIATSALAEIGGGGGAAIMEKDYARKQVDLLQIIADNTAVSGGGSNNQPEANY